MLYLSGQAMILSALNVIYSRRLPKSTQRDPLTQRSGLSHNHLSLSLSHSAGSARTHTRTYAWWIHAFYARACKERARTHTYRGTSHVCIKKNPAAYTVATIIRNLRVRTDTRTHAHTGRRPWDASPYVPFTSRDSSYPAGLDLIHGGCL